MNLIVAIDLNNGIGKNGDLLFRIPEDLKRFRKLTLGKTVVMGRSTLESLPNGKPLADRRNIVLSTTLPENDSYEVCRSIEELFDIINEDEEVFVIGGGKIYDQLLPYCNKLYITKILKSFEADTFINLPKNNNGSPKGFGMIYYSTIDVYDGVRYYFTTWIRLGNK